MYEKPAAAANSLHWEDDQNLLLQLATSVLFVWMHVAATTPQK
jgi:hypothetical protein